MQAGPGRELLRHQARVEHALRVEHFLLGIGTLVADGLARLAEELAPGGAFTAGEVLGHDDRREEGAHFDALVQQSGSFTDGFVGRVGHDRVGHAQEQPRAVGVARFQRPAKEETAAARAAEEVGEIVAVQVAFFRR